MTPGARARPSPETIGPRFVYDSLVRAEEALVAAHKATGDKLVAESIDKARRELRAATSRASAVLKHVATVTAEQAALFEPTQEEEPS